MTSMAQTAEKKYTTDQRPPHGMKGDIERGEFLTPMTILSLAGLLLLAAILFFAVVQILDWRHRRRALRSNSLAWTASPSDWARLRAVVDAIELPKESSEESVRAKLWNEFTSSVSICLRRGFELRTGLPLAESTTQEIKILLSRPGIHLDAMPRGEFEELLRRLDEIRFGSAIGTADEAESIMKTLRTCIDRLEPGRLKDAGESEVPRVFD